MKTKLLLITDHFYRENHVAALRMRAIVQYLSKDKFDVFVLTVGKKTEAIPEIHFGAKIFRVRETHVFARCKFDTRTHRFVHKAKAAWNRLMNVFTIDDNPGFSKWGWPRLQELHQEHHFDVVISSYNSLASMKLGLWLKQRDPGVRFICDFRDELSQNYVMNPWDFYRLRKWEKTLLDAADLVSSVSEPILNDFATMRGRPGNFVEVRNGFGFDMVKETKPPGQVLELVYAGSLYHYIRLDQFFKALQGLPTELRMRFRLKIIGGHPTMVVPKLLRQQVQVMPRMNYAKIPEQLRAADALLLVIVHTNRRGVFTGKLYDYLAINRPIFAMVPPQDVAAELIERAGAGYICSNEDVTAIQENLKRLLKDWDAGHLPKRNWDLVGGFHRSAQIIKLENAILSMPHPALPAGPSPHA